MVKPARTPLQILAFTIDFLRFEAHFRCLEWVLRKDSIVALVENGLRINQQWILMSYEQQVQMSYEKQ